MSSEDDVDMSSGEGSAVECSDSEEEALSFFPKRSRIHERNELERYLLMNGIMLHFKSSTPQQVYIDIAQPETYADLSIVGDNSLICAGESANALYFYTQPSNEYLFYRVDVNKEEANTTLIKLRFVRSKISRAEYQHFAIQQPFLLEDNYGDCRIESIDGRSFPLENCSSLFSDITSTEFFCHRGLVYLLKRSNDDEGETKIINAGHVIIIYLEKRYFLNKRLPIFGQMGPEFSVYAQESSLIYLKCNSAVMVIGPTYEFYFVDLDSSVRHDCIVGVENGQVVTATKDGLARTDLGEKHAELCDKMSDRHELEITGNRSEIARLHAENENLKIQIERSEEIQSKFTRDNVKLRLQFGQVIRDDSRIRSLAFPTDNAGDRQYTSKFSSEFEVCKILGVGGFGIVFEAENSLDEWKYAVKRITVPPDETKVRRTLGEVRAMAQLDHPGIVRYNGTWLERPPTGWQGKEDRKTLKEKGWKRLDTTLMNYHRDSVFIYIQMQLCDSSLFDWLAENRDPCSRLLSRMKSWFKQIVSAVQYIHEKKMIHRDLKPRNILLADNDRLKLCDLGIVTARKIDDNGQEISTLRTDIGTGLYMSPEQRTQFPIYSSKTDVFALGLIFAEMLVVMNDDERTKIFDGFRKDEQAASLFEDNDTAIFVAWLANKSSKERPQCTEVINHPYLA